VRPDPGLGRRVAALQGVGLGPGTHERLEGPVATHPRVASASSLARRAVYWPARPRRLAWPRTRPFQGRDRGFESRRGHHRSLHGFRDFSSLSTLSARDGKRTRKVDFRQGDGSGMAAVAPLFPEDSTGLTWRAKGL